MRATSLTLFALLLSPSAHATQRMVASGWPDAPGRIVRTALDTSEPYGVRAAALRVLSCMLALPSSLYGPSHGALTAAGRALVPMTPEALLQQTHLWDALPGMLRDKDAPPGFVAAALAALLQGLCVDIEQFAAHLALPGTLSWLVGVLSGEGQAQLLQAAAGGSTAMGVAALTSTGVSIGFLSAGDKAAAGGSQAAPLQLWPADPYSTVVPPMPASSCGLDMRVPAAAPSTTAADSNPVAAGGSGQGLRVPLAPINSNATSSSSTVEDGLGLGALSAIISGLRPGAVGDARRVAALAAQVLGLAVMESEHVDLAAAGQPPGHLLAGLLVVLVKLGAGIGTTDRWALDWLLQ